MSDIFTVENSNLSIAWAEAFLALMKPGCAEITPLVVTITGIGGEKILEHLRTRIGEVSVGQQDRPLGASSAALRN